MSNTTTVHEIHLAFVVTPADDALGSLNPLLTKEQTIERVSEALSMYIEKIIPNGCLSSVLVKTWNTPLEKFK